MAKLGRNDPCPCGSGKKYKQCCLKNDETRQTNDRADTIPIALEWLQTKHDLAIHHAIDHAFFGSLDAYDYERLQSLDEDVVDSIIGNAIEWLLAEGSISLKGKEYRVAELLLGKGGPAFTEEQRQWLELMSVTPLRLYEVIEVKQGEFLTLRDAMLPEHPTVRVEERTGSQYLSLDKMVAARILPIENHFELSGAAYVFPKTVCIDLIEDLRNELEDLEPDSPLAKEITGTIIPYHWLQFFINPSEIPSIVDQETSEPLLYVTDHYRVLDWVALDLTLSAEAAIEGSREQGWRCFFVGEDGQIRSRLNIDVGKRPDRIKVSYLTQKYSDEGRPWFETLAGASIVFLTREISDPQGMVTHSQRKEAKKFRDRTDRSPEAKAEVVIQGIQQMYVNWADEPLPYLNDRTPREAIQTPEGLEQVKFLLHAYEHHDPKQAKAQRRDPVMFAFLWQSLGITP